MCNFVTSANHLERARERRSEEEGGAFVSLATAEIDLVFFLLSRIASFSVRLLYILPFVAVFHAQSTI